MPAAACDAEYSVQEAGGPVKRIECIAREFDRWQQHHRPIAFAVAVAKKFSDDQAGNLVALLAYYAFLATFPLLLALTTILGLVLRNFPRLQRDLLNSTFAEFPIIGAQIHDQLGVASFGNSFSLIVGLLGAFFGGRGFANALQNTVSSLWAVPRAERPGFPANYLRTIALLLLLTVGVALTAAASAAAGVATACGFGGFAAHLISIGVGTVLGWGYFLAACRVATPAKVPTRWMLPGAGVSALAWQLLLTGAGVIVAHLLRHAQAVAGLFGLVLGLLAWFGLQATVVVYAIQADVVRAKRLWPRSLIPPPLTEADKAYYSDALRAQAQRPEQRVQIDYSPEATAGRGKNIG
jgi:YihY family inner membrane protein